MRARLRTILCLIGTAGMMLNGSSARAGTVSYDFTTDPTKLATNPIEVYQTGFADGNGTSIYWKDAGGNPGGFLGLTWPLGGSSTIAIFPDIDPGKVVTSFTFDTDLRIGNPQQNVRAADGFSINFARATDPVFENHASSDFATSGAVETGTQTGLAISFDTWAGNGLPDGTDIEGIIVRVDNKTVLRYAMPTRNGACNDVTSLQTGPRDGDYWTNEVTGAQVLGTLPDAAFLPETWTNLCWQHLSVVLDTNATLTVTYKGLKLLDKFQTTFFPSAGRIVLAGRTGGADEHGHFDNLTLTTTASTDASPPTAPANLKVAGVKARRVQLAWDAATDDSGKVAYNIDRDGTIIASFVTGASYIDRSVVPSTTYSYKVQAVDPAGNKSAFTTAASATTPAEVLVLTDVAGFLTFEAWNDITGTPVDALTSDPRYPDAPDFRSLASALDTRTVYPNDGHENYGGRLTGLLTPTDTADYDFFLRSDDAAQLWLSTDANAAGLAQIAEEVGCCAAFLEPGDPRTTAAPIHLLANTKYYIQVLWKEGGGGDYAQVAWRKAGDTTAAANLTPIPGTFLSTKADTTIGPPIITKQPADQTVAAGATATFSVEATFGEQPVTYQWQFKGADIPGATSQTLAVNNASLANSGAYNVVVSNLEGSATSSPARLIITGIPTVLFVHATTGPNASDLAAMARIKSLGWQAIPQGAVPSQASDADGKALIVISSTVTSGEVGDKFRNVAVPNFVWESAVQDNFDETDRANDADTVTRGVTGTQTQINIVKADHPMAAGLGAGLKTYLGSEEASWGVVGPGATVVGTIADDPTHASLYVYEKDATLFDGTKAPARFVHFPGGDNSFLALNADGLKLFDAGIMYAAGGTPAPPAPSNSIPSGLVAYWNFDGNLLESLNGFDGTSRGTNPVAFVDGQAGFGKAVQLNGTNFVEITGGNENNLEFPKGSMSIAGWFKVDAFDKDWQALIAKGEGSNYRVARRAATNSIAYAGGVGEGADDVPNVNDGKWHHFAAISDATGAAFGTALYIDGVKHGTNATKPVLTANAQHLMIGENPEARGRQWNGEIDDIGLWNRVLTDAEISALYAAGTGTPLSAFSSVSALVDQDITRPGDPLVASSTNTPAAEIGANVIDNQSSTKYLNFDKLNTGFTVTPSVGSSVINGIALTSANDSPERDPASYKIEGSNDGAAFTLVSEGTVGTFTNRFIRQKIRFTNTAAYTSYRVTFPTVANATSANSMQIAEVELLGTAAGGPPGPKFTSINKGANGVTITWAPATAVLQSATVVTGPYSNVPGATGGTYTAPLTDAPRFFRLQ